MGFIFSGPIGLSDQAQFQRIEINFRADLT